MINIQKHIISEAFEQLSKSAKLNESKFMESNTQFDIHAVLNANGEYEDLTEVVKDPSKIIVYDTWNQMLKDRDNLHTYYIRQNGSKEYEVMKYSKWSGDQYVGHIGPRGYSSLKELYDRNPGKYDTDDVCLVKEFHVEEKLSESKLTESNIKTQYIRKSDLENYGLDRSDIDDITLTIKDVGDYYSITGDPTNIWNVLHRYDLQWSTVDKIKESKLTEAPMDVKDYAARLRARKAEKGQNPLEKINYQLTPDMSITDQLQVYFDELVPASGPAKTVAGELVRAIMRILYRDYNDGDLWYTGYGKETCGDSVVYLVEHIEDLQDLFDDMIYKQMEDAEYTDALEDVASRVMVYLNEHPELFTTPLDKDSRSGADLESYFELPTYEFEPDTSYDAGYYDVSDDDIDEFIHDIVESDFRGATVNRWASDGWTIEGLDKEQLEYLEDVWEKWFNDFLSQYEREEEPEEDYEDEDSTAEADWDDSTDNEFDESLKESVDDDRFKRSMLTQKIFYEYPDISEDDEDYLNSLSYDALVKECKNRGWEDLLKDFDESLNKDNQKRGKRMKIVAEDFQECNLNKMGTNEYEANTNRQKHINMYRKFANLNDDEVITEDMIDDLALTKTATYCNREPDRIKAEILGQRYSEYEQ